MKKNKTGLIIGISVLAVIILLGGFLLLRSKRELNLKIGDYVAYTPEEKEYVVKKEYSGSKDISIKSEKGNWVIWDYNDEEVTLISEKAVNEITFKGAKGFNNDVKLLNEICDNLYSTSLGKGRSINLEDISKFSKYNPSSYDNYGKEYQLSKKYKPYILDEDLNQSKQSDYIVQGNGYKKDDIKAKSNVYEYDLKENMDNIRVNILKQDLPYIIATRAIDINKTNAYYGNFSVVSDLLTFDYIYNSNNEEVALTYKIRPMVTIKKADILHKGDGSKKSPYLLNSK